MPDDFDELKRFAERCERAGIKSIDLPSVLDAMLKFFGPEPSDSDRPVGRETNR
jgi:hypothetical protein